MKISIKIHVANILSALTVFLCCFLFLPAESKAFSLTDAAAPAPQKRPRYAKSSVDFVRGYELLQQGETEEGLKYIRRAAKDADPWALCLLADMYMKGNTVGQDFDEAFSNAQLAASKIYIPGIYRLGLCYENGYGVERDVNAAITQYIRAAREGLKEAQMALGRIYFEERDYEESAKWYRWAAFRAPYIGQSDTNLMNQAKFNLGVIYLHGLGVERNLSEALNLFEKSAEQGDAKASFYAAEMYFNGEGCRRDAQKALRTLEISFDRGYHYAAYRLGSIYAFGEGGVDPDPSQAAVWLGKGAETGLAEAQYALGAMYLAGSGVEKNTDRAVELISKAAEVEYLPALFGLGRLYCEGVGVEKDLEKAKECFRRAADHGYELAVQALSELEETK